MSKASSPSSKEPSPDAMMRLGATATVVGFAPPKRRGRPRKPPPVVRRCKDDFDTVAMGVVGIASKPALWNATKERVRRWADRDRGLRPASTKVLGFFLEHINRRAGYDWHSADTIASDVGLSISAVEKAFHELVPGGYLLRESEAVTGRRKATRRWRTTIPALKGAAMEVSAEREAKARARLGLSLAGVGPGQKIGVDPDKKTDGPGQKSGLGPGQKDGCSLREPLEVEPLDKSPGCAGDHPEQEGGKRALQEEPAPGTAFPGEDAARETGPSIPRFRPSPRYDRTLPMEHRLSIPGGRYAVPETPDDQALRRSMDRAARGRDLHDLHARFCSWAVSANTPDAIEGFIAWMWTYVKQSEHGYVDLSLPPNGDITDTTVH